MALLGLLLCAGARAQPEAPPETRAAWVLDSRLVSRAETERLIQRLAGAGFNLALVRTWFQGATLYPSDVVAAAGGPRQHSAFNGRDPLAEAIEIGRRYGVRIGAWMEYGLAERLTGTAPGPILTAHPEWRMLHQNGQDYSGTESVRQYWMDPALPEVRAFVRDLFAEVATRYPDLALLEYDRFRYPSPSFSYRPEAVARYQSETGQPDPRPLSNQTASYVRWREAQTTRLAGEVYRAVKAANPAVVVGAAVVPPYMFAGAEDKMQDWPTWADSGYVDVLEPMLYASDAGFVNLLASAKAALRTPVPLFPGIGADTGTLTTQVAEARRQGMPGMTLWYEGGASDAEMAALRAGPFAQSVLPSFDDLRAEEDAAGTQRTGPWSAVAAGHAGQSLAIPAGASGTFAWPLRVLRAGTYDLYAWTPADAQATPWATYSVAAPSPSSGNGVSVSQKDGGGAWRRTGAMLVARQRGNVEVMLGRASAPGPQGTLYADAVRLVRAQPFRIEETLAADPRELQVRFTYPLDLSQLLVTDVLVDGAPASGLFRSNADPSILHVLLARDLPADRSVALSLRNVKAVVGYAMEPTATTVRLTTAATLLDDTDAGFSVTGTWTPIALGTGGSARTAPQGAVLATWFTRTPAAGRYAVDVFVPEVAGRAARLAYLVGHRDGFDTVRVNTGTAGWTRLGLYAYEANGSALVRLLGAQSEPGTLVADAARWMPALAATAAEAPAASGPGLRAFPNPARATLRLQLDAPAGATVEATLFDVLGRHVGTHRTTGPLDATLPLADVAPGVYVARVTVRQVARVVVHTTMFVRRP